MQTMDFEREYGVNAGYVQAMHEAWRRDAQSVDASWRSVFEQIGAGEGDSEGDGKLAVEDGATEPAPAPAEVEAGIEGEAEAPVEAEAEAEADAEADADADAQPEAPAPSGAPAPSASAFDGQEEPLAGIAGRIARNMEASLELPTATSVRTLPAKLLFENRQVLNEHMQVRALGKASYTHLIAFALVKVLAEMPRMQASFARRDGQAFRREPAHVNLGLAIDLEGKDGGRSLVVPSIKAAEQHGFLEFYTAYEELVARARDGKLAAADFQGTTVTLTNPGGFGTTMSNPRLMPGQGLIVATGSIGVPPELVGASSASLAGLALGPVMTVTSTYDHRVIQGAESGRFLARLEELLLGADGFYDDIFRAVRVPWQPFRLDGEGRAAARDEARDQAKVWMLINAYRVRGSRLADLDPLEYKPDPLDSLDPASYGFTVWDLDRSFGSADLFDRSEATLREILAALRRAYCRRWTVEYMHIADLGRKHWVRERVENPEKERHFDGADRLRILTQLSRAENFERFLHSQYVGNKRFSLEGADSLIPALGELLQRAAESGVEQVVIGMAHRGRLNVLANILGKSYEQIFDEFEGVLLPLASEGSGDVKYHLGQRGVWRGAGGRQIEVFLCANPSHLEAVDPVVCGLTRALQDALGDAERKRVLAVLIHGDAAFSGQGVVSETLNMSALRAYTNGGTVHLVVNNQIGFTAGPEDLRSTYYCTDVAKSIQAPILHANGDYPEAVLRAVDVALDYQREHGRDVVLDMVCYRRWGHNEGDEPAFTQPLLYARIREHLTVRENYTRLLIRRGALTREEATEIGARFDAELRAAVERSKARAPVEIPLEELVDLDADDPADYAPGASPETGVPAEQLVELVERANRMPEDFVTHPNLLRQLRRREAMVRGEQGLDWGCAELVAFGSLLSEGVSVRLSGQDSGRGTFSHRHAVIRDQRSGAEHVPLRALAAGGARFEAWDSLLSEEAVLAFEYGYTLGRPRALTLWEAQFGDFVNGAQIAVDQFLAAGNAKWKQTSGLVLLLPHGYDGQGPEHSSCRPERFLSLCSSGNLCVANCSTPAQYFHLLRRQARAKEARPLIVLTPKSLLRDKRATSAVDELAAGRFEELLVDPKVEAVNARRLILCSGKLYFDLVEARDERGIEDVAVARLEQLYPFPRAALERWFKAFEGDDLVWCQEEPRNMGAWTYMLQRSLDLGLRLRYVGRPDAASPATGSYKRHVAEQQRVIDTALG